MAGECRLIISSITRDEREYAPPLVRQFAQRLAKDVYEDIELQDDMRELAQAYISEGILGQASEHDALHVAAATVARADLILS